MSHRVLMGISVGYGVVNKSFINISWLTLYAFLLILISGGIINAVKMFCCLSTNYKPSLAKKVLFFLFIFLGEISSNVLGPVWGRVVCQTFSD